MLVVPVGFQLAASATGHNGGQIGALVQHAAAETGAIGKHHVIQQRAVAFLNGIHFLAYFRKLPHVKVVALLEVAKHLLVFLIVRLKQKVLLFFVYLNFLQI